MASEGTQSVRFVLARVWQALWGLPQTVAGLVLFLGLRRPYRRYAFRSAIVTEWPLDAGLSLGMFIFVPQRCPHSLLVHEYGHTLQSLLLGPLYLVAIVVPSLVWAGLPLLVRYRAQHKVSYYRFPVERWANRLSKRVTKEIPLGWDARKDA